MAAKKCRSCLGTRLAMVIEARFEQQQKGHWLASLSFEDAQDSEEGTLTWCLDCGAETWTNDL